MSLLDAVRRRFARPPEAVRAAVAASPDADERVLAWGVLARDEGWLVATSGGLRTVPGDRTADGELWRWHQIGAAKWQGTADGGGSFAVTPLTEVEPGVQGRLPERRLVLIDRGELPAVVRRRVDQTVVSSRRASLPNGGSLLVVARRVPGQEAREWTVVFDDDDTRNDPAAREVARQKLEEALAAERPG